MNFGEQCSCLERLFDQSDNDKRAESVAKETAPILDMFKVINSELSLGNDSQVGELHEVRERLASKPVALRKMESGNHEKATVRVTGEEPNRETSAYNV